MSEDQKISMAAETLAEQLQAGHRSRLNKSDILFHEVQPDEAYLNKVYVEQSKSEHEIEEADAMRSAEQVIPDSYLNYAAQLLEQMRGVYSTSWDSYSNGSTWHGGHNHFYNPCSGADVVPSSHNCPVYDCTNQCGCNNTPQPVVHPPHQTSNCGCNGTATYYDDCAYQLQKMTDQLNRMEMMISEMYSTNQQLFSYLIEYYNAIMTKNK